MPRNCLDDLKATLKTLAEARLLAKDLLLENDALRADAERNKQSQEKIIAPLLKEVEEMKKEQLRFKAQAERAEGKLERAELLLGSADEELSRLLDLCARAHKDFLKKTTTSRRKRTKRGRRRKSKGKKRRTRR